jgi:hypothetical protein
LLGALGLALTPLLAQTAFLTGQTPQTLRNNTTQNVGMQFQVQGTALTVQQLGRWCVAGNTGTHVVKLVTASTGADLSGGSVSINMTGCTAGQYNYASLSAPVTLAANTSYILVSGETNGGDYFYDYAPVSSTSAASITGPVYSISATSYYLVTGANNYCFVPVNFQYTTGAPPTVTITSPTAGQTLTADGTAAATAQPSSPNTITSVQFKVDGSSIGTATASPYSHALSIAGLANGTHTLMAVATDSGGGTGTTSISFNVNAGISSASQLITGQSLNYLRNNATQFLGMKFTVGSTPLNVTQLGRWCVAGNSQTHTVKLVSAAFADLTGGTAQVSMAGCTANSYQYAPIAAPLTLQANTTYLLVSQETSGGDHFYDYAPVNSSSVATVVDAMYSTTGNNYAGVGVAGYSYVPVNLQYTTGGGGGGGGTQPPTVTITSPASGATLTVGGGAINTATASASSPSGLAVSVQFFVDNGSIGTASAAPYSVTFPANLSSGTHTLTAKATDSSGNPASASPVSFSVVTATTPSTPTPMITYNPANAVLRNDFTSFVGMQFVVGPHDVTVSALGRLYIAGNSGTHQLKLVDSNGHDVPNGSVTVNMASPGVSAGNFAYVNFQNPVPLSANNTYSLVSQENSGGDNWYDYYFVLVGMYQNNTDFTVSGPVYNGPVSNTGNPYNLVAVPNQTYVPVNLLYSTSGSAVSSPAPSSTVSTVPLVTSFDTTTTELRNNYGGWVGMQFTTGSSAVTVGQLGRYVVAGNTGTHTVELIKVATLQVVASAQVATAGQPAGQFAYTTLVNSVHLDANTSYYLASLEVNGGDYFYDSGSVSTSGIGTVTNAIYYGINWTVVGGPGTTFGPVDLTQVLDPVQVTPLTSYPTLVSTQTDPPVLEADVVGQSNQHTTTVTMAFLAILNRYPDYASWNTYNEQLNAANSPDTLSAAVQQMIVTLMGSPEAQSDATNNVSSCSNSYPTDQDATMSAKLFVQCLYIHALGNSAPDSAGLMYWVAQLTSGALNRSQVAYSFIVCATTKGGCSALYPEASQFTLNLLRIGVTLPGQVSAFLPQSFVFHISAPPGTGADLQSGTIQLSLANVPGINSGEIDFNLSSLPGQWTVQTPYGARPSPIMNVNYPQVASQQAGPFWFDTENSKVTPTSTGYDVSIISWVDKGYAALTGNQPTINISASATDFRGQPNAASPVAPWAAGKATPPVSLSQQPPSVLITVPSDGTTITTSPTFVVQSNPATADPNAQILSVTYSYTPNSGQGSVTVGSQPWQGFLTTPSPGSYTLTATVTDSNQHTGTQSINFQVVGNVSPTTISVTPGASSGRSIFTAVVTPGSGETVDLVTFTLSSSATPICSLSYTSGQTYSCAFDTTQYQNGPYTMIVTVLQLSMQGTESTVSQSVPFAINNAANTPTTISITSPASGTTVSGTSVMVAASVSAGAGLSVNSVQFQVNGASIGSAITAAPFNSTFDSTHYSNGSYSLTALATDSGGNTVVSPPVQVTISNGVLSVSITAPTGNSTVSGTAVNLTATASAAVGKTVSSVQFQVDGANAGAASTSSPYSLTLDTTAYSNGTHTITAIVTDSSGATVRSGSVTVTVNNTTATGIKEYIRLGGRVIAVQKK